MRTKRLLASLLALVMLFSLLPSLALAEEIAEPVTEEQQPAPDDPEAQQPIGPPQGLNYGYYLIGRYGWTINDLVESRDKFETNYGASTTEYKLITTLEEGQELQVVLVSNGTQLGPWYPDGSRYTVDAAHAGTKIIYFRTTYNNDWAAFGGYFYITDPPTYQVSITQPQNGRLEVDKPRAMEGETVTITAIPDDGYYPQEIKASAGTIKSVNAFTYLLTMPAQDVTVYMWNQRMKPAAGYYLPLGTNVDDLTPAQRFVEESTEYGEYYYDAELTEGQQLTVTKVTTNGSWAWLSSSSVTVSADEAGPARIYLSLTQREGYTPIYSDVWLKIVSASAGTVTVSFDAGEGSVTPTGKTIAAGAAIGALPIPTRENWKFVGWYMTAVGEGQLPGQGTEVTTETTFNANTTVYAHWRLPGDVNGDGQVNNKDVLRLLRYIKDKSIAVVKDSTDVNGDKAENNKDVLRLLRYIKDKTIVIY